MDLFEIDAAFITLEELRALQPMRCSGSGGGSGAAAATAASAAFQQPFANCLMLNFKGCDNLPDAQQWTAKGKEACL
jgi:hypothetical protein